ncbi:hypothetical protein LCI18_011333 [Fusarium solani-melongenae]|uniref:Uncharacterized protein n=1 Tax=Fusarium solani subsp. cucurbitae TaxID=2747967 RepID=A0ACD3ZJX9_FUSSC|nr:hypothetical protein LCI18_011333 [Fusarium solani-melongenae]
MARIYSSAVVVYSWVGPNDYTLAFETLVTLSRLVREKTGDRHHSKYPKHLTFQPEWLRQHHNLCDPKDEPGSLHQGNPWLSIFCLGSEEYWKRIWIFQEVVLARRLLLLSSGDKILEWEDVPLVSSGMNRLASEVHKTRQSKPNHISEKAWRFIIELCPWRRFGLVRIGRLQVQTPSLEHAEYTGWIITNIASRLKATDPRDYIYGLLGVTKIPILPDHTPGKPLSELFVEYVTGWLNATCGRERPLLKPLSFLSVAGVGLFCSSDNLPSWVPNYPGNARRFYTKTFLPRLNHDNSDIPENPAKDPYFVKDTQSLFVWGSKMGPIDTILEERDCNDFQVFYSFLKSFMTRHAHYVSGAPSIQALCQVLRAENESKVVTSTTVMLALCITSLPSSFDRPDPESPPASPWYHEWETRFYDFAFPGIDMQQLGFTRIPAQETLSWSKDQRNQLLSYLTEGDHYVFVSAVGVLDLDIQGLLHNLEPNAQWFELR